MIAKIFLNPREETLSQTDEIHKKIMNPIAGEKNLVIKLYCSF